MSSATNHAQGWDAPSIHAVHFVGSSVAPPSGRAEAAITFAASTRRNPRVTVFVAGSTLISVDFSATLADWAGLTPWTTRKDARTSRAFLVNEQMWLMKNLRLFMVAGCLMMSAGSVFDVLLFCDREKPCFYKSHLYMVKWFASMLSEEKPALHLRVDILAAPGSQYKGWRHQDSPPCTNSLSLQLSKSLTCFCLLRRISMLKADHEPFRARKRPACR